MLDKQNQQAQQLQQPLTAVFVFLDRRHNQKQHVILTDADREKNSKTPRLDEEHQAYAHNQQSQRVDDKRFAFYLVAESLGPKYLQFSDLKQFLIPAKYSTQAPNCKH